MAHVRAQIRDAVAVLIAGLGATVLVQRTYPLNDNDLPVFLVYTGGESSEPESFGNAIILGRELELLIEVIASGSSETLDDTLDDFAVSIETVLADEQYSGLAKDTLLMSTSTELAADGNKPVGMMKLTYGIKYRTVTNDAATART